MAQYTCTACTSVFQSSDEQRSHYKLDWHRYNLKRKIALLPSVSQEDFNRRVAAIAGTTAARSDFKGHCSVCRKSFGSEKLLLQHYQSKKHRSTEKGAASEKSPYNAGNDLSSKEASMQLNSGGSQALLISSTNEEEKCNEGDEDTYQYPAPIGPDICIFCNKKSEGSVEGNIRHMRETHGFFLPDSEYLVDREGLIMYCSEKVKLGYICLTCNGHGRGFHSWRAVQQHMFDVSHCRLLYEEGEDLHEFESFYDFSPSYGDLPDERVDSNASHTYSNLVGPSNIQVTDIGELLLSDGRIIGHRQYDRYYKQTLHPADTRVSTQALEKEQKLLLQESKYHDNKQVVSRMGYRLGNKARNFHGTVGEMRQVQYLSKRDSLKTAINNNRLNRTFTRVLEC